MARDKTAQVEKPGSSRRPSSTASSQLLRGFVPWAWPRALVKAGKPALRKRTRKSQSAIYFVMTACDRPC